jgi:hypothetical protein
MQTRKSGVNRRETSQQIGENEVEVSASVSADGIAATGLMSDVVGGVRAVRALCHEEGAWAKGPGAWIRLFGGVKGGAPGSRVNDRTAIESISTASWWVALPQQVGKPSTRVPKISDRNDLWPCSIPGNRP